MSARRVELVDRCLTNGMLGSIERCARMLGRLVDSVLEGPVGGDGRTAAMTEAGADVRVGGVCCPAGRGEQTRGRHRVRRE